MGPSAHIQLRSKLLRSSAENLIGKYVGAESYSALITSDATVYDISGQRLLVYAKGAIPDDTIEMALPALRSLKGQKSLNRGAYAGSGRAKNERADGYVSNTNEAAPVASSVVGYFDRYPRIPFCRETAFTANQPAPWASLQPLIQAVAQAYCAMAPDKYMAAMKVVSATHKDWIIPSTPFTTLTVNNTVRAAVHTDKGDLKAGLGVIMAIPSSGTRGCELIFPEHGVAVELGRGDLLLFNSHEMHGNGPFAVDEREGRSDDEAGGERVSIVFYYREGMRECGSMAEEQQRAKHLRGSLATTGSPRWLIDDVTDDS